MLGAISGEGNDCGTLSDGAVTEPVYEDLQASGADARFSAVPPPQSIMTWPTDGVRFVTPWTHDRELRAWRRSRLGGLEQGEAVFAEGHGEGPGRS